MIIHLKTAPFILELEFSLKTSNATEVCQQCLCMSCETELCNSTCAMYHAKMSTLEVDHTCQVFVAIHRKIMEAVYSISFLIQNRKQPTCDSYSTHLVMCLLFHLFCLFMIFYLIYLLFVCCLFIYFYLFIINIENSEIVASPFIILKII